ncbi:MAG: ABC transporter permease [Bacteroidales bacterium]|nr:ABC transporter permease [Bacteroidales bacterium]
MRTILYILQKEFRQIFRNKSMLPIIFVIPVVQLLILAFAVTFEIKNINLVIVDMDHSVASRQLVSKFSAPPFYHIKAYADSYTEAEEQLKTGKAHQILIIPNQFENDLQKESKASVQLITNAIDGSAAAIMNAYGNSIILDYNKDILVDLSGGMDIKPPFDIRYSYWFNPELDYKTYMVPGILVLLVTIIGMFLSSMNVVREKEMGTIEQINVSPVKKYQFVIGKLLPFWFIALFELAFGLTLARIVFDIPILGSLWLIFGVASVYLLATLGIGLLISTLVNTQQQAMFLAWFFAVVFIMMSGLFTPVDSMPEWAQNINIINPIAYFIRIIRMIMLKGSQFQDILKPFMAIAIYAVCSLTLAVWRYRKVAS